MTETGLERFKLMAADGTGHVLFDFTKVGMDKVWFEVGVAGKDPSVAIMSREEGREIARVLWANCKEPPTVRALEGNAPRRPRPAANLQRNVLTEESERFPNRPWKE